MTYLLDRLAPLVHLLAYNYNSTQEVKYNTRFFEIKRNDKL